MNSLARANAFSLDIATTTVTSGLAYDPAIADVTPKSKYAIVAGPQTIQK